MIALNQFRTVNGFLANTSYPSGLLDVLHEEEESGVVSPATVQLTENQQQLEQLNLHQNYGGGGGGLTFADGNFLRCGAPPSIVITGVGSRPGSGHNGNSGGGSGGGGGGGAIALR